MTRPLLIAALLLCGGVRGSEGDATSVWHERHGGLLPPGASAVPSLAPLVKAVKGAVVHVEVAGGRALGSGFILDPRGWVVTNAHVLGGAEQVKVRLAEGPALEAKVVGRDATTDLAILRIENSPRPLPFAVLGDSDALEVGDWVIAVGNPFGLSQSVSHGVLSAKERVLGLGPYDDFLQTDVFMNPGNSGGPLFNLRGEVVGVTTARVSEGEGIGFALPINLVKELLPQLIASGKVNRGWLGLNVAVQEVGEGKGAVVKEVVPGGPAGIAGIQPGDRLLTVDGRPVESYLQLLRRVALTPPGKGLRLRFARGLQTRELVVTAAPMPSQTR